jgi:hypothetical protein
VKPAAGYRPLAYSSPEAVQTTETVANISGYIASSDHSRAWSASKIDIATQSRPAAFTLVIAKSVRLIGLPCNCT